jgi:hypothetical protein
MQRRAPCRKAQLGPHREKIASAMMDEKTRLGSEMMKGLRRVSRGLVGERIAQVADA